MVEMNSKYYGEAMRDSFEFTLGTKRTIDIPHDVKSRYWDRLKSGKDNRFGLVIHGWNDEKLEGFQGQSSKYNIHGKGKYPLFIFNFQLIRIHPFICH